MEIEVSKNTEKAETSVKVSVSAKELEPYIKEAAKKLTQDAPLKGFRPGKAPVDVVEEAVGKERLLNEAIEKAVPRFFVKAVMEKEVDAIARPAVTVDELSRETGLKFTAIVVVLPQVDLGDLSRITVKKKKVEVTDDEIEKELKYLVKSRSTYIDVVRPAKEGDTVTVDFSVELEGKPMEGGESKNHPIHLGEGHFVPEFEKNILGMEASDNREFSFKFPDDFAKEDLRGKEATAKVTAHSIQQRILPKIDDEFAKKAGKFKNLKELKYALKSNTIQEKEQREQDRWQGEMTAKLAEGATFSHISDALIDKEIDRRVEEMNEMLSAQSKTIDDYLAGHNKTVDELRGDMKPVAERNVKVGLALRKLAEQENIIVDEEELNKKTEEYLRRFKTPKQAEQKIDPEEIRENVGYMLRNQKALKRLEELVTVTETGNS